MTAPTPNRAEGAREDGQTAYEAWVEGEMLPRTLTPWRSLSPEAKIIWEAIERKSAARAEAKVARLKSALSLLLPFVDHSAGQGIAFFLGSDQPDMDAADLCMAASAALGIECGGDEYDAILAAGRAARAALQGGDHE